MSGNLVYALDIDPAGVGEEHQVIVRAGAEEVLDEVLVLFGCAFAGGHADDPFAAAPLGAIGADVGAFDQAVMADGDDDAFIGDEVFDGHFAFVGRQFGQARRGVFFLNRLQFALDDRQDAGFPGQDIEQVLDAVKQLAVLGADLVNFQAGQLVEAQVQNRVSLGLGEGIAPVGEAGFAADADADALDLGAGEIEGQQLDLRLVARGRSADDADELVQVAQGHQAGLEGLRPLLGLAQFDIWSGGQRPRGGARCNRR